MRTRTIAVALTAAAVLGAVWLVLWVSRSVDAGLEHSAVPPVHLAVCTVLQEVIVNDQPWPADQDAFVQLYNQAVREGEVTAPDVNVSAYVSVLPRSEVSIVDNVCEPGFPVVAAGLTCEERDFYGGRKLLECMHKHRAYFNQ